LAFLAWAKIHHADVAVVASVAAFSLQCNHHIGRFVVRAPSHWPLERQSISGLVVEYIVAIDVTRVRFPADALSGID
jgi:hypothetical protein